MDPEIAPGGTYSFRNTGTALTDIHPSILKPALRPLSPALRQAMTAIMLQIEKAARAFPAPRAQIIPDQDLMRVRAAVM